jgi:hypothetical protein
MVALVARDVVKVKPAEVHSIHFLSPSSSPQPLAALSMSHLTLSASPQRTHLLVASFPQPAHHTSQTTAAHSLATHFQAYTGLLLCNLESARAPKIYNLELIQQLKYQKGSIVATQYKE